MIQIKMEGHIAGVEKIVGEIFFDDIAFVATADDKLVDAIKAIGFENMPENGFAANLNHRLRFKMGFFADSCAKTASKDDSFHC